MQNELMVYDPATQKRNPYPSQAAQWRTYHGKTAWLYNPWTGDRRDARDVGSDPFGILVVPPSDVPVLDPEFASTCTIHDGSINDVEVDANPDTCAGSLVFKGTRLPVRAILSLVVAGSSDDEIKAAYPTVTDSQLRAVNKLTAFSHGYAILPRKLTEKMDAGLFSFGVWPFDRERLYDSLLTCAPTFFDD